MNDHTARIDALLSDGSREALTLAALRGRLALEMVCYERLRNAHDYISPDDLKRWQPREVVNRLIQDVDPHIASALTVSISKAPASGKPPEAEEYVELGQQAGFDAKRLGKIWNALGNFLHVRTPRSSDDQVCAFGDAGDLERKVREALGFLRDVEKGTLITSGLGETVSFVCNCGSTNKRRSGLLAHGQIVSCVNPDCIERWDVEIGGTDIGFRPRSMEVSCHQCKEATAFPEAQLLGLVRNQMMRFSCRCGAENHLMWKLMHMKRDEPSG
ncbi:hypothetical protein [Phenylobacterium sp.]|uniref:hypothetical protein n=1 Tax=Phenylobacterium sp. TaxID=1871053 RepID=UPI0026282EB3|nr:hypothetical protein [Phenylobacterium sp.]